jgi:hypothetical protein
MNVAVIVLSYNQVQLTLDCLNSIRKQDYSNIHIYVVDNASTDDSVEQIRKLHPEITILTSQVNLGYAGGNNLAITRALKDGVDCFFLVNNDTILDRVCVRQLVERIRTPGVGVVGPMVYTWESWSEISSAGGVVDWGKNTAENVGAGEIDTGQYPARQVDFVNGCGIMVTRAAIRKAGILDEKYFMYWEETDWCMRIHRAGFHVWFEPSAKMQHKAPIHSVELSPRTVYYLIRNRFLFFARYTPMNKRLSSLAHILYGALAGMYRDQINHRSAYVNAVRVALLDAFLNRWGQRDRII